MSYVRKRGSAARRRRNRPAAEANAAAGELPQAVRALENGELRALLVALLREWRERTHKAGNRMPL